MQLTLAYSPCPNDTFIFDAITNKRINLGDLNFSTHLADVEALNKAAGIGKYDITKLSFNAFLGLSKQYELLDAGSALGNNCGPLLIKNSANPLQIENLQNAKIAIPGVLTTANFLLDYAFSGLTNKVEMVFSDIEGAVKTGEVDAGVIIHENRFTYAERGFEKIIDLGEYWEKQTAAPIPLGGIVIRRSIAAEIKQHFSRLLQQSVEYAFENPTHSQAYIADNAQEMDREVLQKHIELYVNDYTRTLGTVGRKAITIMHAEAIRQGRIVDGDVSDLFLSNG